MNSLINYYKIYIALFCVVFGSSFAAPVLDESQAVILNSNSDADELGNYNYWFETSNGIKKSEQGIVRNVGLPEQYIDVTGQYSYTDPEGKFVLVRYHADDTGFHILPTDQDLPLAPALGGPPPALVASLLG